MSLRSLPVLLLSLAIHSAQAASPASGTLSDSGGPISYDSGPFAVSNATTQASLDSIPTCQDPVAPCDSYALTVHLPPGYLAAHPGTTVRISTAWDNPTTAEDYDVYLDDGSGKQVNSSASSADPEVINQPVTDGDSRYSIVIVPFTVAGSSTTTTVTLITPAPAGGAGSAAPQSQPLGIAPRYKTDVPPPGVATTADEPSIGYNYKTRNGMYIANLVQYRLVFPWNQTDAVSPPAKPPEACNAEWLDVTYPTESQESLDPILHTNSKTGRTFVSQLTGANSLFAFTDDDGASWTQGQVGPPNGGPDHQTVGTGPYPAGSPFAMVAKAAGFDYATYYCSQATVGAVCSRSDDGGLSFGPGAPVYIKPVDCGEPVGAIHGHVKVGPDGAVYVPPKSCGTSQAVSVSTDAGNTWKSKLLPNTTADTEVDPSVAPSDPDATGHYKLYDCFIDADGRPHAQVSTNNGDTWGNDYDLGRSVGVVNATFPEAVAGDPDRASCAFIGTDTPGNHDAADFKGIWYAYIATTYDGGKSWFTINLSPNDPVQGGGGVCNGGTLCGQNRNLYDFNEITLDEQGRVLFGYADGCTGACVIDPIGGNAFESKGVIGRQYGGRGLLSRFDPVEPVKPNQACLGGFRSNKRSHLTWATPDTGGETITNYNIYRAAAQAGPYSKIWSSGAKNSYDDTSDNTTSELYYRVTAVNSKGEGLNSNIVKLPITPEPSVENSCSLPGVTMLVDAVGDSTGGIAETDVTGLHVAELPGSADKLTFTISIASLSPLLPDVYYLILTRDTLGNPLYFQADTVNNPGGMAFSYGSYANAAAGVLTFTEIGKLDASSTYDSKTGNIILVVPRALLGNPAPGKALVGDVRVRQGSSSATSRDAGGPGSYIFNGIDICAGLSKPLADLSVNLLTGSAPLTVSFDGASSSTRNAGASISSYHFEFGDGSAAVAQSSPTTMHVYQSAGTFAAKLSVTDSKGMSSSNSASKFITISGAAAGTPPVKPVGAAASQGTGRFGGGSLGWLLLLPLLAASRRRQRGKSF